jgi:hypothetical protein
MRRIGAGLLVTVVLLAVPGLAALAVGLMAEPVATWPSLLCAAGGGGFVAIVVLMCVSPPQDGVDDDSEA